MQLRQSIGDDGSHYPKCEAVVQEFWDYDANDQAKAIEISEAEPATHALFLRLRSGWNEPVHPTPVCQKTSKDVKLAPMSKANQAGATDGASWVEITTQATSPMPTLRTGSKDQKQRAWNLR